MPKPTATGQRQNYKSKESVEKVKVLAQPVISFGYSVDHPDFRGVTWHDVSEAKVRANVHSALARRFGGMNVEVIFDDVKS